MYNLLSVSHEFRMLPDLVVEIWEGNKSKDILARFNAQQIQVLLLNYKSATSWNFQQANHVILLDADWLSKILHWQPCSL